MGNERNNVNREYKDRLFKLVFREKEDLLNLYEHQSTCSPNLPLRGLFYFADLYRKMMAGKEEDLYSSRKIRVLFRSLSSFTMGRRSSRSAKCYICMTPIRKEFRD